MTMIVGTEDAYT